MIASAATFLLSVIFFLLSVKRTSDLGGKEDARSSVIRDRWFIIQVFSMTGMVVSAVAFSVFLALS